MAEKESKSKLVQRARRDPKSGYQLTAEEAEQFGQVVKRIIFARNQRELPRDEFDGLSYESAYLSNRRAAMSYLTPKKNDNEVRINTGTTEKRIELVLNEFLGLNLQEEIRAFDKNDNLLRDVSDVFTDMVLRTEQIEMATEKDIYIYKELLIQPSVFVEELWVKDTRQGRKKSLKNKGRCERRTIQGVQMYLGDVNMPDYRFHEQPYLVKYARMTEQEAEATVKPINPDKWEFVRPGTYQTVGGADVNLYRKGSLENQDIEVYTYMSGAMQDNEVQIYVNGVPFLDVGHKYTDMFGDYGWMSYHMTMVGLNPYAGDFAYSKPLTQSAKTLQALSNETIRNLVRKFRQAIEPPMGVVGNKMFSRDIWNPGSIVQGIRKDMFEKLVDHGGITRGEMTMFDLIEKKTNEFIGAPQTEPLAKSKGETTATEIIESRRQATKLLGLAVLSAMRLKNRLALLRVRNILNNVTRPVGKEVDPLTKQVRNVYASFGLDGVDVFGQEGTRNIQLLDRGLTDEEKKGVFQQEQRAKKRGKPFQFRSINVPALRDLELFFYAVVAAKPKESSELDKTLFREKLVQGAELAQLVQKPLKAGKWIDDFESTWKSKGLFERDVPQIPNNPIEAEKQSSGQSGRLRPAQRPRTSSGGAPGQQAPQASNLAP